MQYTPARMILYFFLIVISLGTVLLALPFSHSAGHLEFIDIFFTAVSAVCVTGLSVVDISNVYSVFGQLIILILIQIGGLGYMTLSTILGLFIGKIALKERVVLKELFEINSFSGLLSLLKKIVIIVFLIESVGAILLTIIFLRDYSFIKALYYGVFHSISAFCNAGFSLFSSNLTMYAGNIPLLLIISVLVITGGVGFLVIIELHEVYSKHIKKISLHTRIVLLMTAVLLIIGTIVFYFLEMNNTLSGKNLGFSLINSFFQSVAARTAGFNTLSTELYTNATGVFLILLMFVGAASGGTGGGIKISTFFIVILFMFSTIKDRNVVNIFGSRISEEIVHKATVIFILAICGIVCLSSIISIFEPFKFIDILFETVSAFSTVGFSRGITADLSISGKIMIVLTMIIGRLGPLTFLVALLNRDSEKIPVRYPEEKVMIG